MNAIKPLALALVALVALTGTATAAPGNAPVSTNNTADQAGPPATLPDAVPDFVGEIHDMIRDALGGPMDGLGDAISDIAQGASNAVGA